MAKKQKVSQKQKFLSFMGNGRLLSTRQARVMFSSHKPSARVRELRIDGHPIVSTTNSRGNFAYKLVA
jgi:hypothetical protein